MLNRDVLDTEKMSDGVNGGNGDVKGKIRYEKFHNFAISTRRGLIK